MTNQPSLRRSASDRGSLPVMAKKRQRLKQSPPLPTGRSLRYARDDKQNKQVLRYDSHLKGYQDENIKRRCSQDNKALTDRHPPLALIRPQTKKAEPRAAPLLPF